MQLLSFETKINFLPENILSIQEVIVHLTKLNDNVMVYVKKIYTDTKAGSKIYEMSNGLSCTKNEDGKWFII